MNFATTSVSPSGTLLGALIIPSNVQNRRKKSTKHFTHGETNANINVNITKLLEMDPILKLPTKKNRKDLVLDLVQSQSQFNSCNNSTTTAQNQNKRPQSTPYSRSFTNVEDIHQTLTRTCKGDNVTIGSGSINKSRLPDIQMINKYYGLVPKKFTVHSRQGTDDGYNKRKLRAKSAFKYPTKNSSLDEPSGSGSDTESPTWARNGHRKRKDVTNMKSTDMKNLSTTFTHNPNHSLQTRKISVERQNKLLKHRGRSSSLPLLGSDNRNFPTSPTRESQRVIKIDLNNMSWEETCPSCSPDEYNSYIDSPSEDSPHLQSINSLDENDVNGNEQSSGTLFCNPTCTTLINFDNDKSDKNSTQFTQHEHDDPLKIVEADVDVDNQETQTQVLQVKAQTCEIVADNDDGESGVESNIHNGFNSKHGQDKIGNGIQSTSIPVPISVSGGREFEMVVGNTLGAMVSSSNSHRMGRLKKTISFDEQILRHCDESSSNSNGIQKAKHETENTKSKRPLTASGSSAHRTPLTNTPHPLQSHHHPKVLPWTQKGMSLSERRSKLQKSVSIHSTDSFDFVEECSDTENATPAPPQIHYPPPPNSSAYKETRKSLFFQPPAEVSTMVSQISPIETVEIQVEIEKVAVILNNMQNQNKSFIDLTPDGAEVCVGNHTQNSLKVTTKKNLDIISTKQTELNDITADRDLNGNSLCNATLPINSTPLLAKQLQGNANNYHKANDDYDGTKCPRREPDFKTLSGNGVIQECSSSNSNPLCKNQPNPVRRGSHSDTVLNDDTISTKVVQTSFRPQLKKAVSISCEKELLDTSATDIRNEVNCSTNGVWNNGNKSSRPKTPTSKTLVRTSSTPAIIHKSNSRQSRSSTEHQNRCQNSSQKDNKSKDQIKCQPPNQNVVSSNKKLLKKALIEINQSAAQLGNKKWGAMGRPKTAPSQSILTDIGSGGTAIVNQNYRRQPLRTSPGMAWNKSGQPVRTKLIPNTTMGRKTTATTAIKSNSTSTSNSTTEPEQAQKSEESGESEKGQGTRLAEGEVGPRRTLHRQSFSLDEGMLLGFSNKEFGWNSSTSFDKLETENSFQSSKKREECLKIYEKMLKTGMTVKLDTIFRGMMTPSEYRVFIKAAENAARELEPSEEEKQTGVDAGVTSLIAIGGDLTE